MMYRLEGHKTVEVKDARDWARWFDKADRSVGMTAYGKVTVSTVFLGVDHNFSGMGDPILFETMVFAPDEKHRMDEAGDFTRRYRTWDEAQVGHAITCSLVKAWMEKS